MRHWREDMIPHNIAQTINSADYWEMFNLTNPRDHYCINLIDIQPQSRINTDMQHALNVS